MYKRFQRLPGLTFLSRPAYLAARCGGGAAVAAVQRSVATEAGQLRKGDFFDFKGKKCVVMKASQQINNRKAFAIVEFREVESGNKHKETIQAGDKFEKHWSTPVSATFLYADDSVGMVYFQNPETFEQIEVPISLVGRSMLEYLDDGQAVSIICTDAGDPLFFEPPKRVPCKVEQFDGKVATLENGRVIAVPAFIKEGDTIMVDPEEEKYLERA